MIPFIFIKGKKTGDLFILNNPEKNENTTNWYYVTR